jgi:hypothetical protein
MEDTMEHRLSIRIPSTMSVTISYRGLGLLQGVTLNVSRHGMYVATGPMVLPHHSMVDVAFPLESGKCGVAPQWTSAMVVRIDKEGIGLMFAEEIKGPEYLFGCEVQDYPRSVETASGYAVATR